VLGSELEEMLVGVLAAPVCLIDVDVVARLAAAGVEGTNLDGDGVVAGQDWSGARVDGCGRQSMPSSTFDSCSVAVSRTDSRANVVFSTSMSTVSPASVEALTATRTASGNVRSAASVVNMSTSSDGRPSRPWAWTA
jgi:hypothetical protein